MLYSAAVIGGGASGLMCSCLLSSKGKSVIILEGESRVGKKLLATGNGKCNLSHKNISSDDYRYDGDGFKSFIEMFPYEKAADVFGSMGLLCREDAQGRIYPYSLQASTVLDVLRDTCKSSGVNEKCDFPVVSVKKKNGYFEIYSADNQCIRAEKVILACGSHAGNHLGCRFGGYEIAKQLGHSIVPLTPSLVPIKVSSDRVRALKGIRCRAKVTLESDSKILAEETGEVQFTDNSLSGICIFNLSAFASKGMKVNLDLMPEYEIPEISEILRENPEKRINGILNKRISQEILKFSGKTDPLRIAKAIKCFSFDVIGLESFERAQCASGGVPLSEIDIMNMRSRICEDLYIIGELLNVDGKCGGYNLHFAWSSAIAASQSILKGD